MATTKQLAARVLLCGAMALVACGLADGVAAAAPAPSFHWCPGQPWDQGWGSIYDWDWNQCHDWERSAGQGGAMGNGPWGLPPSWAPPQPSPPPWAPGASVMWNMTARAWGFWNNKTWTPL
jgi:hypothetical protein